MQQVGRNYMDDMSSQGSYMIKQTPTNTDMKSEFAFARDDQSEASQMQRIDK